MTSKDFENLIEEYNELLEETHAELPLSSGEIAIISEYIGNVPEKYKDAFDMACDGVFDNFEKLPYLLRNYLGALELKKFRDFFGEDPSLEREDVRAYLEDHATNAALRAGISAEKNVESTKYSATALDTYMNGILMKRTMLPPTEAAREQLAEQLNSQEEAAALIERNKAKQLVIAKTMLLAQIGKYDVVDKNGLSTELDVPVYETLVHGNRTNFILPAGVDSNRVIDSFMGANGGADAGIEKRTAATHSVKLRSFSKSGAVSSEGKELRTYNPLRVFFNQYGMDIAAGGIGEKGPDRKTILGDGESGHMYMRAEAGDEKHCGSLLIGIEGSAPGKDSNLGNTHGILAKSAKQSAFLADKSIVGKKVGGRQVDLSGVTSEELTRLLDEFSEKYSALQQNANTNDGREKLALINDMLMGNRMDIRSIMDMFDSLGMNGEGLNDIVSSARKGYLAKVDAKQITRDDFVQSIRAKFSQEKACKIAMARFEYAGNDLNLASGAIKELIFTHETRSLGWKILHPIRNYRENATISTLMEKLESEKGFDRAEIASAFGYYDDTFSLDWGKNLSYDPEIALFQRVNKFAFKESENKLLNVLRSVCKAIGTDVVDARLGDEEVEEMQDELWKINNNIPLDRENVVVEEATEADKRTEVSMEIIPEQPEFENVKDF